LTPRIIGGLILALSVKPGPKVVNLEKDERMKTEQEQVKQNKNENNTKC